MMSEILQSALQKLEDQIAAAKTMKLPKSATNAQYAEATGISLTTEEVNALILDLISDDEREEHVQLMREELAREDA